MSPTLRASVSVMDPLDAATRWARVWHDAWEARDTEAFDEERSPRVWVGTPIVAGDRAAIEWWAAVTENGIEITLAGVSVLHFDAQGLVVRQWDSWNQGEGLLAPPQGWGERTASSVD